MSEVLDARNVEAEQYVLGSILLQQNLLDGTQVISEEDFTEPMHKIVFGCIRRLMAGGEPVNAMSVGGMMQREQVCEGVDGRKYALQLSSSAMHCMNFPDLVDLLVALTARRRLILACNEALLMASDEKITAGEVLAKLTASLDAAAKSGMDARIATCEEVGREIVLGLNRSSHCYSTGLKKLDMAMGGGLFPGKAYGFAARKKHGKTILACSISHNLNLAGVKHLFICGEMSKEEVHQRCLSRVMDVYPSAFVSDYSKSPDFQRKAVHALWSIPQNTLYLDAPGMTFDSLRTGCATAVVRHGAKGIILDYWQLVGGKGKSKSTSEHLDEVAQWIADFCRQRKVWAIVMAQINQDGNTRGSEGIRLAFDQVYAMHRPDLTQPGAWLEMMETRYTQWMNLGTDIEPGMNLVEKGLYFQQAK